MAALRWFARRPAAAPPSAGLEPPGFDAIITVGSYNLPGGVAPARAILAIREAVSAIPGAAAISVEHHPAGSAATAVTVSPGRPGGPPLGAVRERVQAAVSLALAGLRPPLPPPPNPPGFAEGAARFAISPAAGQSAAQPWEQPGAPLPSGSGDGTGRASLAGAGDAAVLAALLARVLPDGAEAAARRAVDRFGSYAAVLAQPAAELSKLPGLGPHSVAAIKLVHAAALRLSRASVLDQPALTGFDALIQYLTAVLAREPLEHFRILFLDAAGRIRADEAQARGTVNHTPVYPREVVRRALELGAGSVILVHNHPSGDPSPSQEDLQMTRMVQDACRTVGLDVRDHIIVGNGRWFSFREEGCLDRASPLRR